MYTPTFRRERRLVDVKKIGRGSFFGGVRGRGRRVDADGGMGIGAGEESDDVAVVNGASLLYGSFR